MGPGALANNGERRCKRNDRSLFSHLSNVYFLILNQIIFALLWSSFDNTLVYRNQPGKANSLLEMPVTQPSSSLARAGVNIAAHFPPFSASSIRARDIIIIHPFRADLDPDTGEDCNPCPLIDNIVAIALDQGCRVTVIPVAMQDNNSCMQAHQNLSLQGETHDISCFQQPIFIVAPTGPIPQEALKQQIELLCDTHQFSRQDLVFIEPADTSTPHNGQQLISKFRESGFERISAHQLDLSSAANPGWLIDQVSMGVLQESFEAKLTKLLDSFNLSIFKNANYQLEMIDSSSRYFSMPTFLQHMLANRRHTVDNNFILVWPQLNQFSRDTLPATMKALLGIPNWIPDDPAHFSRLQIFCAYPDTDHLRQVINIDGSGQCNINIVFASCQHEQVHFSSKHLFPAGIQARHTDPTLHLARPDRRLRYDEPQR
jgi:hypothetical protein